MPLFVVSTPIGNLEDITQRALRVLRESDLIAAEDTRVTGRLLKHFGISTPAISNYEQNEKGRVPQLMERLRNGESIALVSSAGTPAISDPGFPLVRACIEEDIPVVAIPGPSAHTSALVCSGLPVNEFWYRGFSPRRPGKRRRFLEESAHSPATLVFYESPYRVIALLEAALEIYGDRRCALCRELTKKYEEIIRGSLSQVLGQLRDRTLKGEFVVLIEGLAERPPENEK